MVKKALHKNETWSQGLSETFTLQRLTSQLTGECILTNLILIMVPVVLAFAYLLIRWEPWVPWELKMVEHELPFTPLEDFGTSFSAFTESIG